MSLLRSELHDAAISAAKANAHAEVEPRHVLFAIAKKFRPHASVSPHYETARRALEPRGVAHGKPAMSAAATSLLDSINDEQQAVAAFATAHAGGRPATPVADAVGGQARQSGAQVQVSTKAATATPHARETVADVMADLERLIGLGAVKAQVKSVLAVVQANTERVRAGLKPVNPTLHLVFTGPPGTGKTTVARLVARLYAAAGALKGAGFNEASRADLVAGYVGQTAIKTAELITRTRPGVLFIDEAYALSQRADSDFGSEAIATLVKAMEDHREEFAVIVAGYEDEMSDFIGSNPGLRSRFKTYIAFPDYSPAELVQIFERLAAESGIALGGGVKARAHEVVGEAARHADFGNARFVRSLFEQAYARMAARAAADGKVEVSELTSLTPDDLKLDLDTLRREQRRIGFEND